MSIAILHLIDNLESGGAQTRLINDLKFIDKNKFNNIVCSLYGNGQLCDLISGFGWQVFNLKMNRHIEVGGLSRLVKIIKSNRVDILHTQLFFADIIGRFVGRFCGIPHIVTTIQSSVYEPDNKFLFSRKRKIVDSITGRLLNERFIAVSEFVKESIVKRLKYDAAKIEVINNYVDTAHLDKFSERQLEDLRSELNLEDEIVFVAVGRLNSAKGQKYILQALPQVLAKHKCVRLLIIGDGPDSKILKMISADLGIDAHVQFLGERPDVRELLHLSDVFILLTESEGLCLAILEAMAAGKSCIISDIGPNREIVESMRNGILVNPYKLNDVAGAINLLIEDAGLRKALGESAKLAIREKFSHYNNVAKLEQLYEGLMSQKPKFS